MRREADDVGASLGKRASRLTTEARLTPVMTQLTGKVDSFRDGFGGTVEPKEDMNTNQRVDRAAG